MGQVVIQEDTVTTVDSPSVAGSVEAVPPAVIEGDER